MDQFKVFRNSPTSSSPAVLRSSPPLRSNNAPEDDGVEIGLDLLTNSKKKLQGSSSSHLASEHTVADSHPFDRSSNQEPALSFKNDLMGVETPKISSIPPPDLFSSTQDDDAKSHVSVKSHHSSREKGNQSSIGNQESNFSRNQEPSSSGFFDRSRGNTSHSGGFRSDDIFTDQLDKKKELLYKIDQLGKRGYAPSRLVNLGSSLDEIEYEYERCKKKRDVDNGIKFSRKMLMACITGIEFLNNKFDPFDIKLDGWSESIHENLQDYDEVFEELYEKYKGKTKVAPEIRLLLMVGGSGFMFHLTNTLFKTSLPGMGDIMKQNPDLMKQFAKAAMTSMGNNLSGGGGMPSMGGGMPSMDGFNQSNPFPDSTVRDQGMPPSMARHPFPQSTQRASPRQSPRQSPRVAPVKPAREMRAPIGVDDILNELQSEMPEMDDSVIAEVKNITVSPTKRGRRRRSANLEL